MQHHYAPAGLDTDQAETVAAHLQERLDGMLDLGLTLKHVHWNVVGRGFIGVHEMLDDQVAQVRAMADELAERIATLGGVANGLPGGLVKRREWDDYSLGRASVPAHLGALDKVFDGVIRDVRKAIEAVEPIDVVTEDLLTGQAGKLEMMQWFVRAHLENVDGELPTTGETTELDAAAAAATAPHLS